ncbi:MAG: molybdopterin-dependent oxidoreductase [Gemmatimonadales bacterium]
MRIARLFAAALLAALLPALLRAQNPAEVALRVAIGPATTTLSWAQLDSLPSHTAALTIHGGSPHQFTGASLADVLCRAGAIDSKGLRGPDLARTVTAVAADSYRVVFPLADFDSTLTAREVLVAWREEGAPLDPKFGPLQLIVSGDKHPSRSEHQLIRLDVSLALPRSH